MARRRSAPSSQDLESIAGRITPSEDLSKSERINFLVSPTEKREIKETAKTFGLTTTDYLLRLHRLTRSMLQSPARNPARDPDLMEG
jgi:hypothetical protein